MHGFRPTRSAVLIVKRTCLSRLLSIAVNDRLIACLDKRSADGEFTQRSTDGELRQRSADGEVRQRSADEELRQRSTDGEYRQRSADEELSLIHI